MFECSSLWCDNDTQKRGLSACRASLLLLHHESQWSNDKPEKSSSILLLPNLSSILKFLIQICPSKNIHSLEHYLIRGYSLVHGADYMTKAQFQECTQVCRHTCHTSLPGKTLGSCLQSTSTNCYQNFFTITISLNNVLYGVSFLLPCTVTISFTIRTYLHENCRS